MKKILLLVLAGIGVILTISIMLQKTNVQAHPQTSIGVVQSVIGLQNLTLEPAKNAPVPQNATEVPAVADLSQQENLISVLNELESKVQTSYPNSQTGWYLLLWNEDGNFDAPNQGVLPNGAEIPAQYTQETWLYVDSNRMVTRQITLMKTMKGEVFQAGVHTGEKVWNSATNETQAGSPFPFENLLFGMHEEVKNNIQSAEIFSAAGDDLQKEQVEIVTLEKYIEPVKLDIFDQQVIRIEKHYFFNQKTGMFEKSETVFFFVDGSQKTGITSTLQSIQPVAEPSEEAMAYLKESEIAK